MAKGRLMSNDLIEELKSKGYSFDYIGRFACFNSKMDDEGYMKKAQFIAEISDDDTTDEFINNFIETLTRDKFIMTNDSAIPKRRTKVVKQLRWLEHQVIKNFTESTLKHHWHDEINRNDVSQEIQKRKELLKKQIEEKKNKNGG